MKKYIPLCLIVLLAACGTKQVALLSQQEESYPELETADVQILSHAQAPQNCKQISVIITNPQKDVDHILTELRENAAKVGGNWVTIDSMGYMSNSDSENKYAVATVYVCR